MRILTIEYLTKFANLTAIPDMKLLQRGDVMFLAVTFTNEIVTVPDRAPSRELLPTCSVH